VNLIKLKQKNLTVKRLETLIQKAGDKRSAERLSAIRLRAEGKSAPEIAAMLGRHVETVRKWIKLFNEGGPDSLSYLHSGGRSEKLAEEHKRALASWLLEGTPAGGRWSLNELAQKLYKHYHISISVQQVSSKIHQMGLSHLILKPKRRRTPPERSKNGNR
jgi:transposase